MLGLVYQKKVLLLSYSSITTSSFCGPEFVQSAPFVEHVSQKEVPDILASFLTCMEEYPTSSVAPVSFMKWFCSPALNDVSYGLASVRSLKMA